MGVNSVSWAPSAAPGSIISTTPSPGQLRRFVTGGSDNLVKIWEYKYVVLQFLFIYHNLHCSKIAYHEYICVYVVGLTQREQRRKQDLHSNQGAGRPHRLGT